MSVHLTEEEQAENFKRWCRDNGSRVIIGIILGVALYWGWTQWQNYHEQEAADASLVYSNLIAAQSTAVGAERTANVRRHALTLKENYRDSQYARYAALLLAKLAVEEQEYEIALAELDWVIEHGADESLQRIVNLRKSRVEASRGDFEAALALLTVANAEEMASAYAENRGDLYMQLGNLEAARSAYQEALSLAAMDSSNLQILELKLNRVIPAQQALPDTVAESATVEIVE